MNWEDPEDQVERTFSLAEANGLIPSLRLHLARIRRAYKSISLVRQDILRASQRAEYGGGSSVGSFYIRSLEEMSAGLQALQETGVLLKDMELGLCDFPHLHDGRIVYLCWKLGEDEVRWWHEVNAGAGGRQPIDRLDWEPRCKD